MSTLTGTPSCAPVIVQFTHNVRPSSLQCAGGWTGKAQSATTYCICTCVLIVHVYVHVCHTSYLFSNVYVMI